MVPAFRGSVLPLLVSLAVACGSGASTVEGDRPAGPPTPPETPAGEALAWVLDVLNGAPLDAAILQARFHPTFLQVVPVEELQAQLTILAEEGPYALEAIESSEETSLSVFLAPAAGAGNGSGQPGREGGLPLRMDVVTTDAAPYTITGLGVRPAPYRDPALPQGWPAIEAALGQVAPTVALFAAEVDDLECRPIHAVEADRQLPVGSAFKLYVLGALVEAVGAGRVRWDDALPIDPDLRSPSSLLLRDMPDGQPLTLRRHADAMISVSDNTATDHLIHHLGRERVEAFQAQMGHSHPELNVPFLTTREMMVIKLVFSYGQRQDYANGDAATRRGLLLEAADVPLSSLLWGASLWVAPRMPDQIEWFASGADLCRAMVSLRAMGETDAGAPVREILAMNPGTAFDPDTWRYVGYKGGSEPGVLNFTWLLQREDERWFVLAMTFLDTDADIELDAALRLAAAAHNELARTP